MTSDESNPVVVAEADTLAIVKPAADLEMRPDVNITLDADGRVTGVVTCRDVFPNTIAVMADTLTINGHQVSYEMFSSFLAGEWPKF